MSRKFYGCAAHKDRGATVCGGIFVEREVADTRLLTEIRELLLEPSFFEMIEGVVSGALCERQELSAADTTAALKRCAELDEEIARLVDAIASMGYSDALQQRLRVNEAERQALLERTKEVPSMALTIPNLATKYHELVENLETVLREDVQEARAALRELLGPIELEQNREVVWANIKTSPQIILNSAGLFLDMVAGAGFEPTTFGL